MQCLAWASQGQCQHGHRCLFHHGEGRANSDDATLQVGAIFYEALRSARLAHSEGDLVGALAQYDACTKMIDPIFLVANGRHTATAVRALLLVESANVLAGDGKVDSALANAEMALEMLRGIEGGATVELLARKLAATHLLGGAASARAASGWSRARLVEETQAHLRCISALEAREASISACGGASDGVVQQVVASLLARDAFSRHTPPATAPADATPAAPAPVGATVGAHATLHPPLPRSPASSNSQPPLSISTPQPRGKLKRRRRRQRTVDQRGATADAAGGPRDGGPRDGGPRDGVPRDGGPRDGGPRAGGPTAGGPRGGGLLDVRLHVGLPIVPREAAGKTASRVLFVCSGGHGALLSLMAATLTARLLHQSGPGLTASDVTVDQSGQGFTASDLTVDWRLTDGAAVGPVWCTHRLCVQALSEGPTSPGPTSPGPIGQFVESRCLELADIARGDTITITMDDESHARLADAISAHPLSTRASWGGCIPPLAARATPFATTLLSSGEHAAFYGALEATSRASRHEPDGAGARSRRHGGGGTTSCVAFGGGLSLAPRGADLEAHRGLLAVVQRGCIQLIASRFPASLASSASLSDRGSASVLASVSSSSPVSAALPSPPVPTPLLPSTVPPRSAAPSSLKTTTTTTTTTTTDLPAELSRVLESIGLGGYVDKMAAQHLSVHDLPSLSDKELHELGLGWGARRKLHAHLLTVELSPLIDLLRMHDAMGIFDQPPTALLRSLRQAGADNLLELGQVTEDELEHADVPFAARLAVLRAAAATRELAQMLERFDVPPQLLPQLVRRGVDCDALLSWPEVELAAAGLAVSTIRQIQTWTRAYERASNSAVTEASAHPGRRTAASRMHVCGSEQGSPPTAAAVGHVGHVSHEAGGAALSLAARLHDPSPTAPLWGSTSLPGDLRVELALRDPLLQVRLDANLARLART